MAGLRRTLVSIAIPLVFAVWIVCMIAEVAISDWVFGGVIVTLSVAALVAGRAGNEL